MNYNKSGKWLSLKYAIVEYYKKNKILIYIIGGLILLALLTGIFTSIKLYNLDNDIDLSDYSISTLVDGTIYSFKYFLLRLLSSLIIVGILYVFCLNKYLYSFGVAILMYRAFLISLNCVLVIIRFGVGGILTSLLIIFPCHIICLVTLCLIFITFINLLKNKKDCGIIDKNYMNLFYFLICVLLVVDLIEIFLLLIFKPTTILIV